LEPEIELISLPDVPRIVLEHSPLVLALCQVRFSAVLNVANPAFVGPFQHAIQARYPIARQTQQVGFQFGIGSGAAEIQQSPPSLQWQFADQHDNWKVVLAPDFLTIETRAYEQFNDFLDRLQEVLDALAQHIQPAVVTRLGLRYIDEIRQSDMEWSDVIRAELLGPVAVPELIANAIQTATIQQLLLRYPDNQGITIHHGLFPTGSIVQPRPGEEMPGSPFYLLDTDVYREFPLPEALPTDPKVICRYVEASHKVIYRLFRWSVTDAYLSTLEVRRHDPD
jgi:uncharacterized protein (TIGR04255 family)